MNIFVYKAVHENYDMTNDIDVSFLIKTSMTLQELVELLKIEAEKLLIYDNIEDFQPREDFSPFSKYLDKKILVLPCLDGTIKNYIHALSDSEMISI